MLFFTLCVCVCEWDDEDDREDVCCVYFMPGTDLHIILFLTTACNIGTIILSIEDGETEAQTIEARKC